MDRFKSEIAEILEVDNVELNDELSSFECWDSLTILSIIALAGENYNVTLSAAEINKSNTVGGLEELIKSKMS
jgi:acyl carrier protein